VIELNLQPALDLADPVYRAHDHLVEHPIDQQVGLRRQLYLHDNPHLLDGVVVKGKGFAEINNLLG
jgi:hypothetical protein